VSGQPEPLVNYLQRTVGVWRAAKVAGFIVAWGIYSDSLPKGEPRDIVDCGRYWRRSRASIYREQQEFRKAFPDHDTPEELWHQCKQAHADRKSREKATADLLVLRRDWAGA